MDRYREQAADRPRLDGTTAGRHVRPPGDDPRWADAEAAAAELCRVLDAAGGAGDFVGLRVVRNVVGRPVVLLGTVEPDVARDLAGRIRTSVTRTGADALAPARRR